MSRLWPLLAILLAGGLAFLLLPRPEEEGPGAPGGGREASEASRGELIGVGPEAGAAGRETGSGTAPEDAPRPRGGPPVRFLAGLVVDAETGRPIASARASLEPHHAACPRLPTDPGAPSRETDAEGRFAFEADAAAVPEGGTLDLFVAAKGHVGAVLCAPAHGTDLVVRLARGLEVRCTVTDPRKRPVASARVTARPAPDTPSVPGHLAQESTGERGTAVLEGLLPGDLVIDVDHPEFFPLTTGLYDPQRDADIGFVLVPALRATFRLRTDDGRAVRNPTVFWRTAGEASRSEIRIVKWTPVEGRGEEGAEVLTEVVRVPCDAPSAHLEVKADGYAPWRVEAEPLPPAGGERTFDVVLLGDRDLGSLKVVLEDEQGRHLAFAASRAEVASVMRLDGMPVPAGYVLEAAEDLRFPAIPAGPYRLRLRSPAFAPLEVDATAVPGRETEVRAVARPPAKVRVRFVAPEAVLVRFRLTQGGRPVVAIPEGVPAGGTSDADAPEPVYAAGEQGLLLSGLASGSYVIEVDSPDLTAPPTPVRLLEGETEEVEVRVGRR